MIIYAVLLFFATILHATDRFQKTAALLREQEKTIEQALAKYNIPGLAIGIVMEDQLIYAQGFGLRDREKQLAVTVDTLFPIGSCTKALTTFAFGTLVDKGLIAWDQPVTDLITSFRLAHSCLAERPTFRDLCSNQTGMPRHDFVWYNAPLSREDLLQRLPHLDLACDLCKCFEYNNVMFLITGMAMERVVAKPWEEMIAENILVPLGMRNTHGSFANFQQSSHAAAPYIEKEGVLKRMVSRDISFIKPAGGLYSSIRDMSFWMRLLLNRGIWQGKSLIQPQTLAELMKPQVYFATDGGYGLGWYVQDYHGYEHISHDGGVDGFTSLVSLIPKERIGIVILCNKNLCPFPRLLAMSLLDLMLGLPSCEQLQEGIEGIQKYQEVSSHNGEKESCSRTMAPPSRTLEEYTGDYLHPGYGPLSIDLRKGSLFLNYHQIAFRLEPWHYDVFRIVEESEDLHMSLVGKKVSFRANLEGEIDEVLVPFEPKIPHLLFRRTREEQCDPFHHPSYLVQFVGVYEIYHYSVTIALQEGTLIATVPGYPPYELIPNGENEFSMKGGYNVHFVMNTDGSVKEVRLRQPYGIVFTARPKN
jgi:CubicO group peptidase (beta-lactamase class C family)